MDSLFNDSEISACGDELGRRVYTSRLLGRDKTLVLHGGGNTSVKMRARNAFGEEEEILYVKGSGWDLETIAEAGFTPVRLAHLKKLALLPALADPEMVAIGASLPAHSLQILLSPRPASFAGGAAARDLSFRARSGVRGMIFWTVNRSP